MPELASNRFRDFTFRQIVNKRKFSHAVAGFSFVKMTEQENIRLVMVNAGSEVNCRTFVFKKEGHTLGNALRSTILQNPQVIFCGYSMPHPAEDQMHLRIQTVKGVDAQDALLKGLQDLKAITLHAKETFEKSVKKAKQQ